MSTAQLELAVGIFAFKGSRCSERIRDPSCRASGPARDRLSC